MRILAAAGFLLFRVHAASITALPSPSPSPIVITPWASAESPAFALRCDGFSFPAGHRYISLDSPPDPPEWAKYQFIGADPNCTIRGLDTVPGVQSYDPGNGPRADALPRYSRVILEQVWPGIDIIWSLNAARARVTFSLDSPARLPSLAIRLPQTRYYGSGDLTDVRNWGYNTLATVSAVQRNGSNAFSLPLLVDSSQPAPFFVTPARTRGPLEITMEAALANLPALVTASLRTPSGELYQAFDSVIRKTTASGAVAFETNLTDITVNHLALDAQGALHVLGHSGYCCTYFHVRSRARFAMLRLDAESGKVISSSFIGGISSGRLLGVHPAGYLQLWVTTTLPGFPVTEADPAKTCVPAGPTLGSPRGNGCGYLVNLAPSGEIISSRPLPPGAGNVSTSDNGAVHFLVFQPAGVASIATLDPAGVVWSEFRLPTGPQYYAAASDGFGGFWVNAYTASEGYSLQRFPANSNSPSVVRTAWPLSHMVALPGGYIAGTAEGYAHPSLTPSDNALMAVPRPGGSPALLLLDSDGNIVLSSYLPAEVPPGANHTPLWENNTLTWDRYTLFLDGQPAGASGRSL